jgi:anti-sigma regulatory factor (Ser/Thr protein kinase)
LKVAADAAAVGAASAWARSFGSRLGLTERDLYRLELCVTELVANIATYGYDAEGGVIDLRAAASSGEVRLEIVDQGRLFDPLATADGGPARGADIAIGGLGLRLVRGFADECRYERVGNSNALLLIFKRSDARRAADD